MDFWSWVIVISVLASMVMMIVGPLMELRGKILFEKESRKPVTSGRYGMGIMWFGAVLFVSGLLMRSLFSSEFVTPIVIGGYIIWFVGGILAVIRNEVLKIMVDSEKILEIKKEGEVNGSANFRS